MLFIAFSCILGNFNALATLINIYLVPFGFNDNETSYFGAIFIASGLIGAGCSSIYIEKTGKFKNALMVGSFFGVIFYGVFSGFLYFKNFWI